VILACYCRVCTTLSSISEGKVDRIEPLGKSTTLSGQSACTRCCKILWKIVEDGLPENAPELEVQKNRQARGTISPNVANNVSKVKRSMTAKEVWLMLVREHKANSTARRVQLRHNLGTMKKRSDENITGYSNRVCKLKAEMTDAGSISEYDAVLQAFWSGLPSAYEMTIQVILGANDLAEQSLERVHVRLLNEEHRKLTLSEHSTDHAVRTQC
jgi:hypothetical protein